MTLIVQITALVASAAGLVTAIGALLHSQNNRAAMRTARLPDPLPRWKRETAAAAQRQPLQRDRTPDWPA